MTGFMKKLKFDILLIFAAVFAFFFVFSAVNSPEVPVKMQNSAQALQDFPENPDENLSDTRYALRQVYRINPVARKNAARRNSSQIPSQYRTGYLSSPEFAEQCFCSVGDYFYEDERIFFHLHLKYSLPLRAGPFKV